MFRKTPAVGDCREPCCAGPTCKADPLDRPRGRCRAARSVGAGHDGRAAGAQIMVSASPSRTRCRQPRGHDAVRQPLHLYDADGGRDQGVVLAGRPPAQRAAQAGGGLRAVRLPRRHQRGGLRRGTAPGRQRHPLHHGGGARQRQGDDRPDASFTVSNGTATGYAPPGEHVEQPLGAVPRLRAPSCTAASTSSCPQSSASPR